MLLKEGLTVVKLRISNESNKTLLIETKYQDNKREENVVPPKKS